MDVKTCVRCGETKPTAEFHNRRVAADGLNPACKVCACAARRAGRNVDREHAYGRRWRDANPGYSAKTAKAWREANPERRKANHDRWASENAERLAEAKRAWYEANREWVLSWATRNPEGAKAKKDRYNERHPDRRREQERRRQAVKRGARVSVADLDQLWTGTCALCESELSRDLTWPHPMSRSIDHIVPLARGGEHAQHNLQWTHLRCNISKGAKTPSELARRVA